MREIHPFKFKAVLGLLLLGSFVLGCSGEPVRQSAQRDDNGDRFDITAPEDESALQIRLELSIGDGSPSEILIQPNLSARLRNTPSANGETWEDLIGSEVKLNFGSFGLPLVLGEVVKDEYELDNLSNLTISQFENLHDTDLSITTLDDAPLSDDRVKVPALLSEPSASYPLLSDRRVTHCLDPFFGDPETPTTNPLFWMGTGSRALKLTLSNGLESLEKLVDDRGSWRPDSEDVSLFLYPDEKIAVDDNGTPVDTIVEVELIRANLSSSILISNNKGERELPVEIRVVQTMRVIMTYYGDLEGCTL